MKTELTENELRVMQFIDDRMRAEGITYERMSQEDVFPQVSRPELAESLNMTPGESKEALEGLEKKEYISKFRKTNTLDYVIHVSEKWFKRRGI